MLGLVNGSFYALLSLGLAVIFGLMGVVNFAHGAFYTLGAFAALLGLQLLGINYWVALVAAPLAVGLVGIVVERLLLRRLYRLDPLYGLLLTFGLALIAEGSLHQVFGATGESYPVPAALAGGVNLGFMFLPLYRAWVIVASRGGVLQHLVRHRAHAPRRDPARGHRERPAPAGLRCQRAAADVGHLRRRGGARSARGRPGRSRGARELAHGQLAGHRRVRGGGDRRHGLDPGRHRQRPGARHHRGLHQGDLPRGLQHRRVRHHGAGADPAGPPACSGGSNHARAAGVVQPRRPVRARRTAARYLPGVHDEAAVLRHVRLRLQPAARLRAHAVIRARGLLRLRRLRDRLAGERARLGHRGSRSSPASPPRRCSGW